MYHKSLYRQLIFKLYTRKHQEKQKAQGVFCAFLQISALFDVKIVGERIVKEENGKIYQLIAAEYNGNTANDYTESELLFGRQNIKKGGAVLCELILRHIETLKKIRRAKLAGAPDADVSAEDNSISALGGLLNDCK